MKDEIGMKTLKEKVLERCFVEWHRQDDPKVNGYSIHANSGGWYDIRSEAGSIHYKVYEGYPENDEVWPLAATVLGVGEEKTYRIPDLKEHRKMLGMDDAPTLQALLEENIRLLKAQLETPKTKEA